MNIGMVLGNYFPPDSRVRKEAYSLVKAGHNVHLLCMKKKNKNQPTEEIINGISVKRISFGQNWLSHKINALHFYIKFYQKEWAKEIEKLVLEKKIEVLHVHDLPLIKTTLTVGKKYNIPTIADLHENYPVDLYCFRSLIPVWRRIYFENPRRWGNYEKKILKYCNHIITVVDDAKERLIKDYSISPIKITVVSNVVDTEYISSLSMDKNLLEKYKNYFVISYVGSFGPHRGLDTTIEAIEFIKEKIPKVRLLLVGGNGDEEALKKLVKKRNLEKQIIFTGWQHSEKLSSFIHLSNICLVPHHRSPQTDACSPHKFFRYMFMKKPVIVSSCPSLKKIVEETKAGLVFEAGNAKDLADKIIQIYKNPNGYGENGYRAVLSKYNWQNESKKLIELYNKIKNENNRIYATKSYAKNL